MDSTEPAQMLRNLKGLGLKVEVDQLKSRNIRAGDYGVPPIWGIERKTINDFYSSMVNRSLFNEVARLVMAYENPMVAIVGNLARMKVKKPKKWNWILSSQREIWLTYHCSIHTFPEDIDLARFILSCVKHQDESGRFEVSNVKREIKHKKLPLNVRMLMQVDGIGEVLATRIIEAGYSIGHLTMLTLKNFDPTDVDVYIPSPTSIEPWKKIKGMSESLWKKLLDELTYV